MYLKLIKSFKLKYKPVTMRAYVAALKYLDFLLVSVLISPNPVSTAPKKSVNIPMIIKALTTLMYPAPRT